MFDWMEKKENKWWGQGVFSPDLSKNFLLKMERKLSGNKFFLDWQKCPYTYAHGLLHVASFILFLFFRLRRPFIYLFIFFWAVTLPLLLLLFFYFLGSRRDTCFFHFFLTRRDFFWDMIFIFLINLGDCSFLWLFVTFLF